MVQGLMKDASMGIGWGLPHFFRNLVPIKPYSAWGIWGEAYCASNWHLEK